MTKLKAKLENNIIDNFHFIEFDKVKIFTKFLTMRKELKQENYELNNRLIEVQDRPHNMSGIFRNIFKRFHKILGDSEQEFQSALESLQTTLHEVHYIII